LEKDFSIINLAQAKNSITVEIDSVRTDFIRHNYQLLNKISIVDGIRLASTEDIAAMKINGIINRGSKKDFYDIYELLNHFTLKNILDFHARKYDFPSEIIALKSLTYFSDAELEPDPISIKKNLWNSVKDKIKNEVQNESN
jgi:predicted nucleotidyltransferase component of viral defense system